MASTRSAWRRFLIDFEFAKNYPFARLGNGRLGFRNPVLERILPSLLHVKAVAIPDESLRDLLTERGLALPKKYGNGLNARVNFLVDSGIIVDPGSLQKVRNRRNDVAQHHLGDVVS